MSKNIFICIFPNFLFVQQRKIIYSGFSFIVRNISHGFKTQFMYLNWDSNKVHTVWLVHMSFNLFQWLSPSFTFLDVSFSCHFLLLKHWQCLYVEFHTSFWISLTVFPGCFNLFLCTCSLVAGHWIEKLDKIQIRFFQDNIKDVGCFSITRHMPFCCVCSHWCSVTRPKSFI